MTLGSIRLYFKKPWIFLVLQVSNALLFHACGNVGDPLPPLIQIPNPISDLAVTQFGRYVKLSWTLPKLNTDGSAATTLTRFEIYRLMVKPASILIPDKSLFSQLAVKWMVLKKETFDTFREAEKLVVTDSLEGLDDSEIFDNQFNYAIKAINDKKQDAGFSNLVSLRIFPVPYPPQEVHVSYAEHFIELIWKRSTLNIDGSPAGENVKFNVYRNVIAKARLKDLLTQQPVVDTNFKDESMLLGQTYYYVVRSVINTPSGTIESFDSQEVQATNFDTYAPNAPSELTAVSDGRSISLVWLPNTEPDVAGYYVYRRGEERNYQRIEEQIITTASYIDKSVEKGKTYYYRIKAVDTSGNESAYSEEVSDRVE